MKIIVRILSLGVVTIIAFIFIQSSTFGWRIWSKEPMINYKENEELSMRLQQHVYKLSHEIGDRSVFKYKNLIQSRNYIRDQLESFGYKVEFQTYNDGFYGSKVDNVIATKEGINNEDEIVIVGAHYDTCNNPGADDNGSAIAGLLELARLLFDSANNKTIKFIAFVNEEPPFFKTEQMGSRIYARNAKSKKENIRAVLILEMIGYYNDRPNSQRYPPLLGLFYPNKGNFISVVSNFSSSWLAKKIVSSFRGVTSFPLESIVTFSFVPGVDFSDHWSFWKEDYPAVMITDTAFYRYDYYHSKFDTYEKLNYQKMAEVVKGLKGSLEEISK